MKVTTQSGQQSVSNTNNKNYTPLVVNNTRSYIEPNSGMPKFHLPDESRFTATPLPISNKYKKHLENNHDIIETPMSVNRPKFDFKEQNGQNNFHRLSESVDPQQIRYNSPQNSFGGGNQLM
jgi:hypothetical protein